MEKTKPCCTCARPVFTSDEDRIICIYCSKSQNAPPIGMVTDSHTFQRRLGREAEAERTRQIIELNKQGVSLHNLEHTFHLSYSSIRQKIAKANQNAQK